MPAPKLCEPRLLLKRADWTTQEALTSMDDGKGPLNIEYPGRRIHALWLILKGRLHCDVIIEREVRLIKLPISEREQEPNL